MATLILVKLRHFGHETKEETSAMKNTPLYSTILSTDKIILFKPIIGYTYTKKFIALWNATSKRLFVTFI